MKSTKRHFTLEPGEVLITPETEIGRQTILYTKTENGEFVKITNAVGLILIM